MRHVIKMLKTAEIRRILGIRHGHVTTPGIHIVNMWEPYAMLRILNKPVDLIVLNTSQHVVTCPGVRLASQGGTVDWFRFWLRDYQDPDPAKVDQYKRWRELRKLQKENEAKHNESGSAAIH